MSWKSCSRDFPLSASCSISCGDFSAHASLSPSITAIMNVMSCPSIRVLRVLALLLASALLVQCSMPSREAWHYIQTKGLVNYWAHTSQYHRSPPFHTNSLRGSQHYASSHSRLPQYNRPSSNWYSLWGSGMPNRVPYSSSPRNSSNRYLGSTSNAASPRPSPPRKRSSNSPTRPVSPPIEESAPTPRSVRNEPPAPPPASNVASKPASPKPAAELPYGTPVPGRPNMVNSPYAGKTQLVDVAGMGPGQTVKCPYSGKLFKVPAGAQAENKVEPRQESKLESPKLSSEPKP